MHGNTGSKYEGTGEKPEKGAGGGEWGATLGWAQGRSARRRLLHRRLMYVNAMYVNVCMRRGDALNRSTDGVGDPVSVGL